MSSDDAKVLVGALVVTHGQLGRELVAAAETIVGEISHIVAVSIGWNDDAEESKRQIEASIQQVNEGKGVIVVTDMFGGTPSNLTLPFLERNELEIVTGVNLPMIIRLASQTGDESLAELALKVKEQGQRHISIASELLGE